MSVLRPTYHYAILGKKGTGKDTLARELIRKLLETEPWIENVYSNARMYTPHDTHEWNTLHTKDCDKQFLLPKLKSVKFLRVLERAKNSIVYISELSKAIPSRRIGH